MGIMSKNKERLHEGALGLHILPLPDSVHMPPCQEAIPEHFQLPPVQTLGAIPPSSQSISLLIIFPVHGRL